MVMMKQGKLLLYNKVIMTIDARPKCSLRDGRHLSANPDADLML